MECEFFYGKQPGVMGAFDPESRVACVFKEFDFENTVEFGIFENLPDCVYAKNIHDLEFGKGSFEDTYGIDFSIPVENPEEAIAAAKPELIEYLEEECDWMLSGLHDHGREVRKGIGQQIRKAREERGLTVRECADLCRLSKNNYHRVEMGDYNYNADTLIRIASAMGLDITL